MTSPVVFEKQNGRRLSFKSWKNVFYWGEIYVTILKWTIQWQLVHSPRCVATTSFSFRTPATIKQLLHSSQPPNTGNHQSTFWDVKSFWMIWLPLYRFETCCLSTASCLKHLQPLLSLFCFLKTAGWKELWKNSLCNPLTHLSLHLNLSHQERTESPVNLGWCLGGVSGGHQRSFGLILRDACASQLRPSRRRRRPSALFCTVSVFLWPVTV